MRAAQAPRLPVWLAVAALVAACGTSTATSSPGIGGRSPTGAPSTPPAATSESPPSSPPPAAVLAAQDLRYESSGPLGKPADLDVYAPATSGPWPVVVMFHGNPGAMSKGALGSWALLVAAEGFVVFVPTWGKTSFSADQRLTWPQRFVAQERQAACAVAFARAHAADYGGDPSTMVLFGHSAGATPALQVAFGQPRPTDGCAAATGLGSVSSLVTFEGDWLLAHPMWDAILPRDPGIVPASTPWGQLTGRTHLRVVMLVSENPQVDQGGLRPGASPATDGWSLDDRDPSGALRRQFPEIAPFADHRPDATELQEMLYAALQRLGNRVSLTTLAGSTHETIGLKGRPAFLAAFREAAAQAG